MQVKRGRSLESLKRGLGLEIRHDAANALVTVRPAWGRCSRRAEASTLKVSPLPCHYRLWDASIGRSMKQRLQTIDCRRLVDLKTSRQKGRGRKKTAGMAVC